MPIPTVVLLAALGGYLAFLVYFIAGLIKLQRFRPSPPETRPPVSVVVAARNEAQHLASLLTALKQQDYPADKIEFIIVDDRSTDSTGTIIDSFTEEDDRFRPIHIKQANPEIIDKKWALTCGIEAAAGEIIATTDADCIPGKSWVASLVAAMQPEVGAVVGYSAVTARGQGLLDQYQQLDFQALMTTNAGSLAQGKIVSGSGQNLAFRKQLFSTIDGFKQIGRFESGDDTFLVTAIARQAKVIFNPDPRSFIVTAPSPTWLDFIRQRGRWSHDIGILIRHHRQPLVFLGLALILNLMILVHLLLPGCWNSIFWKVWLIKMIFDGLVIQIGQQLFRQKFSLGLKILWMLAQPLYIPVIGIMGRCTTFKWKN